MRLSTSNEKSNMVDWTTIIYLFISLYFFILHTVSTYALQTALASWANWIIIFIIYLCLKISEARKKLFLNNIFFLCVWYLILTSLRIISLFPFQLDFRISRFRNCYRYMLIDFVLNYLIWGCLKVSFITKYIIILFKNKSLLTRT